MRPQARLYEYTARLRSAELSESECLEVISGVDEEATQSSQSLDEGLVHASPRDNHPYLLSAYC